MKKIKFLFELWECEDECNNNATSLPQHFKPRKIQQFLKSADQTNTLIFQLFSSLCPHYSTLFSLYHYPSTLISLLISLSITLSSFLICPLSLSLSSLSLLFCSLSRSPLSLLSFFLLSLSFIYLIFSYLCLYQYSLFPITPLSLFILNVDGNDSNINNTSQNH
jgi:hypothetical protein